MTTASKSIKIVPTAAAAKKTTTPKKTAAAPAVELAAATSPDALIVVPLPAGTRENTRWLIVPTTDGHERWFDKTKISAFTSLKDAKKGTGATVTIKRAELSYRGKTFRAVAANS